MTDPTINTTMENGAGSYAPLGLTDAEGDALHTVDTAAGTILTALKSGQKVADILKLPPRTTDLIYGQAFALLNAGQAGRALPLFAALCVLDGQSPDHWLGHGLCLVAAQDFRGAKLAFSTAHRLAPTAAPPAFHLATLALRTDDPDEARRYLEIFANAPQCPEKAVLAPMAHQMAGTLKG